MFTKLHNRYNNSKDKVGRLKDKLTEKNKVLQLIEDELSQLKSEFDMLVRTQGKDSDDGTAPCACQLPQIMHQYLAGRNIGREYGRSQSTDSVASSFVEEEKEKDICGVHVVSRPSSPLDLRSAMVTRPPTPVDLRSSMIVRPCTPVGFRSSGSFGRRSSLLSDCGSREVLLSRPTTSLIRRSNSFRRPVEYRPSSLSRPSTPVELQPNLFKRSSMPVEFHSKTLSRPSTPLNVDSKSSRRSSTPVGLHSNLLNRPLTPEEFHSNLLEFHSNLLKRPLSPAGFNLQSLNRASTSTVPQTKIQSRPVNHVSETRPSSDVSAIVAPSPISDPGSLPSLDTNLTISSDDVRSSSGTIDKPMVDNTAVLEIPKLETEDTEASCMKTSDGAGAKADDEEIKYETIEKIELAVKEVENAMENMSSTIEWTSNLLDDFAETKHYTDESADDLTVEPTTENFPKESSKRPTSDDRIHVFTPFFTSPESSPGQPWGTHKGSLWDTTSLEESPSFSESDACLQDHVITATHCDASTSPLRLRDVATSPLRTGVSAETSALRTSTDIETFIAAVLTELSGFLQGFVIKNGTRSSKRRTKAPSTATTNSNNVSFVDVQSTQCQTSRPYSMASSILHRPLSSIRPLSDGIFGRELISSSDDSSYTRGGSRRREKKRTIFRRLFCVPMKSRKSKKKRKSYF